MQSQQVVSGGALLAVQGFDVQKVRLDFPRASYGKLARLAGGAVKARSQIVCAHTGRRLAPADVGGDRLAHGRAPRLALHR